MVVGVRIASVSRVRNFSARIVARSFHNACRAACDAPRGAASLPPSLPPLPSTVRATGEGRERPEARLALRKDTPQEREEEKEKEEEGNKSFSL